jgi:hypothetical protein
VLTKRDVSRAFFLTLTHSPTLCPLVLQKLTAAEEEALLYSKVSYDAQSAQPRQQQQQPVSKPSK